MSDGQFNQPHNLERKAEIQTAENCSHYTEIESGISVYKPADDLVGPEEDR